MVLKDKLKKLSLLGMLEEHLESVSSLEYHSINGLRDLIILKYVDIELTDTTRDMMELIRLLSSYLLVAPVCRQREQKIIRVYGEKAQIKLFQFIINKIQEYQYKNGLTNITGRHIRKISPRAYYVRERNKVYTWLYDPKLWKFMGRIKRREYQYKLLTHVARIENLIPDRYADRGLGEFDIGWHVSSCRFQNKKVLTQKCIKGVN